MDKDRLVDKMLEGFDFAGELSERENTHRNQQRELLLSFLEIADSFDRLFAHADADADCRPEPPDPWRPTVRRIARQLEICLGKAGAVPIPCLGQFADPEIHEILEVTEAGGQEEGMIVEVIRRGYQWNGAVLRRPQVAVAGKPKGDL